MVKNRSTLWYAALVAGWAFDILYWDKAPGISFFVHILLILGVLAWVVLKEGIKPASSSYYLVPLILLFSLLTFIRLEPFTRTLNFLLSLGLLGLLLLTLQGGRWFAYTLSDYIINGLKLLLNMIGLPFKLIMSQDEEPAEEEEKDPAQRGWKKIAPYLRGILIALPLITILAALLGEADPIFSKWIEDLIELLRLEKLPEYILRLVLISFWTALAAGALLYALIKSKDEKLVGENQPWPPRFLGSTETTIVMGAINILYFSFVSIQFRYFFGGEKNISLDGYTYAEYARRGFGELLTVAFFTLFIIMVLSSITKRESKGSRITFSALTGAMTAFIGVILISSLQRLTLYEAAYGFSRLRTYSHLCILWIGVLFLAILGLEIAQRHRYFTLASLGAIAGFVLSMNLVNVDSFIVNQNIQRLEVEEAALDTYFLKTLSDDSIPALIEKWENPFLSSLEKEEIAAILACRAYTLEQEELKWQSFTLPRYRAQKALEENSELWEDVELLENDYRYKYVEVGEKEFYCYPRIWID